MLTNQTNLGAMSVANAHAVGESLRLEFLARREKSIGGLNPKNAVGARGNRRWLEPHRWPVARELNSSTRAATAANAHAMPRATAAAHAAPQTAAIE